MLNLTCENSVVLLVVWQERLVATMDPELHDRNLAKALILLSSAAAAEVPVLVTEQYPQGLGPTHQTLREAVPNFEPMAKRDFSCCAVEAFAAALEATGRSHVVLVGMEAHICIYQTARDLVAEGYVVHIPTDAVLSRGKADFRAALGLYDRLGAIPTSVETVVFDWVGRAQGPFFKTVSGLVR
ncbi:MAG: isochorismatase family protein [Myxococcota bacterium]|nr:isochorismatase family protein [Myxococcota bacterium]